MSTKLRKSGLLKDDLFLISLGLVLIIISFYHTWSNSFITNQFFSNSGKLLTCDGNCKYKGPDNFLWSEATRNRPLDEDSYIYTQQETVADIDLISGNKLTLYPNSMIRIKTIGENQTSIEIIKGKFRYTKRSGGIDEIVSKDSSPTMNPLEKEFYGQKKSIKLSSQERVDLSKNDGSLDVSISGYSAPLKISSKMKAPYTYTKDSQVRFSYDRPGTDVITIVDSQGKSESKIVQINGIKKRLENFPTKVLDQNKSPLELLVKDQEKRIKSIELKWANGKGSPLILTIKKDSGKIVLKELVSSYTYSFKGTSGKYKWSVSDPNDLKRISSEHDFQIFNTPYLTRSPLNNSPIPWEANQKVRLSWERHLGLSDSYEEVLYIQDEFQNELIRVPIQGTESYEFLTEVNKKYYWSISFKSGVKTYKTETYNFYTELPPELRPISPEEIKLKKSNNSN